MGESVHIAVDTGGTFTDVISTGDGGQVRHFKLLSTGAIRMQVTSVDGPWAWCASCPCEGYDFTGFQVQRAGSSEQGQVKECDGERGLWIEGMPSSSAGDVIDLLSGETACVLGARIVTGTPLRDPLPGIQLRLGTTRGTNALLQNQPAPAAFFTTRGFGDLLRIGTQQRPDIFAFPVMIPPPIHTCSVEVDERIDVDGSILGPLDQESLRRAAEDVLGTGIRSAAVALLHAWRNPVHELQVEELLLDCGFEEVSISSNLEPTIGLVPRAEAAVVNAALKPVLASFLGDVREQLGRARQEPQSADVLVMTSGGSLAASSRFHAKDSLLSGPAGGVAGAVEVARAWGFDRVLSFDMGGTSTDVARYDHGYVYSREQRVGEVTLASSALDIQTVAAGGGSICHVEDGLLEVGPRSGGAEPGPACYGQGGPLCLTDINLLAGRLHPDHFGIPLSEESAVGAFNETLQQLDGDRDPDAVLDAFLARADHRMATALGRVTLRQGCDPSEFVLVAFGGAGPQHACAIADALRIDRILLPERASVLSAQGIAHSVLERGERLQILAPLDEVEQDLPSMLEELEEAAAQEVRSSGGSDPIVRRRAIVHMRLMGQDATIEVDWTPGCDLRVDFSTAFRSLYGYEPPDRPIEVESLHVLVGTRVPAHPKVQLPTPKPRRKSSSLRRVRFNRRWIDAQVLERSAMVEGDLVKGPALLTDPMTTLVLSPGWSALRGPGGTLLLEREEAHEPVEDLVEVERFADAFSSIASDMGAVLDRCAISVNVKERRDYSCTLHDPDGRLVVNAPHLPVHLGSMGACVCKMAEAIEVKPGDVLLTNHPMFGGSHLPDLTVVTPVHDEDDKLLGWTASRAHHAEIGGMRPGSMPPSATILAEEGVVISPMKIIEAGVPHLDRLASILGEGPWPSRCLEDNLADVRAAIAANHAGACSLHDLAKSAGSEQVLDAMKQLHEHASNLARQAILDLPDGRFEAMEEMDDGTPIAVTIDIDGDRARVDFTGTSGVHPGNLNATEAIVRSVVLYVFRLLIGRRVPLNDGILAPIQLVVPRCMLNPDWVEDPAMCPAVVGGNVETSQRLVNLLLNAMGRSAAGQGTMNNTLFGQEAFGYYETLGGGHGAMEGSPGASGRHCHMSNTRITDPEILEHRYPVRLHRFALRIGSGGKGTFLGGEGLERVIEFLEPVSLSILSQHRVKGPAGAAGGMPGQPGEQFITRAGGHTEQLAASDERDLEPGDQLTMRTPGGGGWGVPIDE